MYVLGIRCFSQNMKYENTDQDNWKYYRICKITVDPIAKTEWESVWHYTTLLQRILLLYDIQGYENGGDKKGKQTNKENDIGNVFVALPFPGFASHGHKGKHRTGDKEKNGKSGDFINYGCPFLVKDINGSKHHETESK